MTHGTPRLKSVMSCGARELPAVVSSAASPKDTSAVSRLIAPDGSFITVKRVNSLSQALFPGFYLGPPHDFSARFAPAPLNVLRI
jgi:hypothetical protein